MTCPGFGEAYGCILGNSNLNIHAGQRRDKRRLVLLGVCAIMAKPCAKRRGAPNIRVSAANGLTALLRAFIIMYNLLYMLLRHPYMDAITYTKARATLAQTIDSVCENHDPVIITKKNDRSVVMLSLEDFQALEETCYLLRNPKNARRLLDSVNELDAGGGTERALIE